MKWLLEGFEIERVCVFEDVIVVIVWILFWIFGFFDGSYVYKWFDVLFNFIFYIVIFFYSRIWMKYFDVVLLEMYFSVINLSN